MCFSMVAAVTTRERGGVPRWALVIHENRIWARGTGRLPRTPNRAAMVKRLLAAAMLLVALCACQQTKANDHQFITGGGNVKVLSTNFFATGDASNTLSGGGVTYVVSKIELSNDTKFEYGCASPAPSVVAPVLSQPSRRRPWRSASSPFSAKEPPKIESASMKTGTLRCRVGNFARSLLSSRLNGVGPHTGSRLKRAAAAKIGHPT